MKSVIVAVQMPHNEQQWLAFLNASGTVPLNAHTQQIAQNVWQVDFGASPTTFAKLVNAMKQFGIPGQILPLDADTRWLPVDSNP